MSVGARPYLGTGLAEMLAERGIEARQSRLKQQEAMAPIMAQAQANALSLPNLLSAYTGNPMYSQRGQQGLSSLLSGYGMQEGMAPTSPQQGSIPYADINEVIPGTQMTLGDLIALNMPGGAGEIEKARRMMPIAFQQEQMKTGSEAVKQATSENIAAQEIRTTLANIRKQLDLGAEPGKLSTGLSLAGKDKLAQFFQNPANLQMQTQLINLYNQLRSQVPGRIFSKEAPTQLLPENFRSGAQTAAALDAIEQGLLFRETFARKLAELQQETRGMMTQADIVRLSNSLADHISKLYEAK